MLNESPINNHNVFTGLECREGCNETLDWAFNNHTCLSGEARYSCFRRNPELARMQSSCKYYPPAHVPEVTTSLPQGECVFGASSTLYNGGWQVIVALGITLGYCLISNV